MRESIRYIPNSRQEPVPRDLLEPFQTARWAAVRGFHASLPGYRATPLLRLPVLAGHLGLDKLWIKDESRRLELGAFKVLGASWAGARLAAQKLGLGHTPTLAELKTLLGEAGLAPVLMTASDGNHGRAVAWVARELGCPARVFLPVGTVPARVTAIQALGADARVLPGTYEDCVEQARLDSRAGNAWLVQDTASPGYETVPRWIMQGYLTLLAECFEQLDLAQNGRGPSHVLLQCGVGSFAAATAAGLAAASGSARPWIGLVEPVAADGAARSLDSGSPATVPGPHPTIMAGLACGHVSSLAWPLLKSLADGAFVCTDDVARAGMRRAARPRTGDPAMESGESGAVTLGLLERLCTEGAPAGLGRPPGLDQAARVLLFSTEGATDPAGYQRILKGSGD